MENYAEGDTEGEETASSGGDHKGEPVALLVTIVPKNKADNGAGNRVESVGNKTAPDP